jgi:hypothetical protein
MPDGMGIAILLSQVMNVQAPAGMSAEAGGEGDG